MSANRTRPARLLASRWFLLLLLALIFGAEFGLFAAAHPEAVLIHRAYWRPGPQDKGEVLKLYEETLKEEGRNLSQRNLYRLAEVLSHFDEPDKAVDVEILLLAQVPDNAGLRYKVANELFSLGRHQEAEAHFRVLAEAAKENR